MKRRQHWIVGSEMKWGSTDMDTGANIPENDFGFSAVTEEDVILPTDDRAERIAAIVIPLLTNLMKDADKTEFIKWPNRGPIIQEQISKINSILRGKS